MGSSPIHLHVRIKRREDMLEGVIEAMFLSKIRSGMPVFLALIGKSSSGKSAFGILMQDVMYKLLGKDYSKFVNDTILITPKEYTTKIRKVITKDKKTKHLKSLQTDEAKFILNSEGWMSFRNKAIRTITATSRAVKPVVFIIIAQLMRDIDKPTRLSLDYYFEVHRTPGKRPRVTPYILFEDKNDPEKPRIRKMRLCVKVYYPNGKCEIKRPIFRPVMPRKEVWDAYKSQEVDSKQQEIFNLLDELDKDLVKMSGQKSEKVKKFAEYLINNPLELEKMGKVSRGKFKIGKDARTKYNYSVNEMKQIEKLISEKMETLDENKGDGD